MAFQRTRLTKDSLLLAILELGVCPQHGAKVVVVHLLLVLHHELTPPLLALGALHLVLIDRGGGVKLGELLLQVLVDVVVQLGQAEAGPAHFLKDRPVGFHVLDGCGEAVSVHASSGVGTVLRFQPRTGRC